MNFKRQELNALYSVFKMLGVKTIKDGRKMLEFFEAIKPAVTEIENFKQELHKKYGRGDKMKITKDNRALADEEYKTFIGGSVTVELSSEMRKFLAEHWELAVAQASEGHGVVGEELIQNYVYIYDLITKDNGGAN